MKVFLTGGTGFIGGHVINQLLDRGHTILAVKRSSSSEPKIQLHGEPKWLVKPLDDLHVEDFIGVDVILHLAAHSANYPYDALERCMYWNVNVPLKVFDTALDAGVTKYVVAGTCFEYGLSSKDFDFIPANAPLVPVHTYPTSKAAASVAFTQWSYEKNVSMSLLRIFQVYGPGEHASRLWPTLVDAARHNADLELTPGEQIRDFIHVHDVANMLVDESELIYEDRVRIKLANLGSGKPRTVRAFAEELWSDLASSGNLRFGILPYRANEIMRYVPDLSPHLIVK